MSEHSSAPSTSGRSVRIAVEGCCHGDLDRIYETVAELDRLEASKSNAGERSKKIELLIICGDFQAVRNLDDLECLACPPKYRSLQQFHKYYSGEAVAPVLTLFVGGNHEASNHLGGLPHGGWVAPNIFYLGNAGVVRYDGLRIAGLSGIYNARHYRLGRHERPPYDPDSLRSAYHVREVDAWRLGCLAADVVDDEAAGGGSGSDGGVGGVGGRGAEGAPSPEASVPGADEGARKPEGEPERERRKRRIDIFVSHDWPTNVARHGDAASLSRAKKHLAEEVADGSLGSPPGEALLRALRPRYWFSAHLHVKFAALVRHGKGEEERDGGGGGGEPAAERQPAEEREEVTRFLALDKCVPGRQFMQVLDVPVSEGSGSRGGGAAEAGASGRLCYDPQWLAVLSKTYARSESRRRAAVRLPGVAATSSDHGALPRAVSVSSREVSDVVKRLSDASSPSPGSPPLAIPLNFVVTAPPHGAPGAPTHRGTMPRTGTERNPQTLALLSALGLPFVEDGRGPPGEGDEEEGEREGIEPRGARPSAASISAAISAAAARVAAAGGPPPATAGVASASAAAAAAGPAEINIDGDGDGGMFEDPGALHNMRQA